MHIISILLVSLDIQSSDQEMKLMHAIQLNV